MVGNDVRDVAHGVNFMSAYYKDQEEGRKVGNIKLIQTGGTANKSFPMISSITV